MTDNFKTKTISAITGSGLPGGDSFIHVDIVRSSDRDASLIYREPQYGIDEKIFSALPGENWEETLWGLALNLALYEGEDFDRPPTLDSFDWSNYSRKDITPKKMFAGWESTGLDSTEEEIFALAWGIADGASLSLLAELLEVFPRLELRKIHKKHSSFFHQETLKTINSAFLLKREENERQEFDKKTQLLLDLLKRKDKEKIIYFLSSENDFSITPIFTPHLTLLLEVIVGNNDIYGTNKKIRWALRIIRFIRDNDIQFKLDIENNHYESAIAKLKEFAGLPDEKEIYTGRPYRSIISSAVKANKLRREVAKELEDG